MEILFRSSLVSVSEVDVNCFILTAPKGAFAPTNVTGKLEERLKLNTIRERWEPLEKAKDCK